METKNELMLGKNQYRLLMCSRMARLLGKGEIYLDATGPKMFWRMKKAGRTSNVFHSIDEMEFYLECLMESRVRLSPGVVKTLKPEVARRRDVIVDRHNHRTNGSPMVFSSRINRY